MEHKIRQLILIAPNASHPFARFAFSLTSRKAIPIALLTLAALTPQNYGITIYNLRLFWWPRNFRRHKNALIGISCMTANSYEAYILADRFRQAGAHVVLGGPHPTALPEEALQHADSVVVGEAESVWPQVLEDFENGRLKKIYRGVPLDDFFTPVYRRFLALEPDLLRRSGLMLSRGCKYHCDFCAVASHRLRFLSIDQAVELIKHIREGCRRPHKNNPTISFLDNNIFSSPPLAKELFRRLIPLKIAWHANASLDIAFDEEALALARDSGCKSLFIGFESLRPDRLEKTAMPHTKTARGYAQALKNLRSHGIKTTGAFILGFDDNSHQDYLSLLKFLLNTGPSLWFCSLTTLAPFPGTRLFERLKKEGRITTFDWRKYILTIGNVVFRPKGTSAFSLKLWFFLIRLLTLPLSPFLWSIFFRVSFFILFCYGLPFYVARKITTFLMARF